MLESYDGKVIRVPIAKKEEYIRYQKEIEYLLSKGKSKQEVIKMMEGKNDK